MDKVTGRLRKLRRTQSIMNIENLDNYVNQFLQSDSKAEALVSESSKINAERFFSDQLMKSFKLLSNPANSGEKTTYGY